MLPFLIDASQHILNYKEHKTAVHFENGEYHVHYELIKKSKKDIPQKDATKLKKDVSQDEYIFQNELKSAPVVYKLKLHCLKPSSNLLTKLLTDDDPPPKI